jgi:hypothetical protein
MNNYLVRGIALTVAHVAIVAGLGGKLLYDRETRPRVWIQTAYYDPSLPIRGRYVSLQGTVDLKEPTSTQTYEAASYSTHLEVENGKLVAVNDPTGSVRIWSRRSPDGRLTAVISDPMLVFLPEHAEVPALRDNGKELWVEVTVPSKGPPRPIRLGVKENGIITPLAIQ